MMYATLLATVLAPLCLGLPTNPTTPTTTLPVFNVAHPGKSPVHSIPMHTRPQDLLSPAIVTKHLQRMTLARIIKLNLLSKRQTTTVPSPCVDATGSANLINNMFINGGPSTVVFLCPSITLNIIDSIIFTAPNQVLATLGFPLDNTRATILITGQNQTNAIYAPCDQCSGVSIRSIQVNGNRAGLGRIAASASAILEMGGNAAGQSVRDCHIYEPRGWSCLHGIEGYQNSCRGLSVINNQIGPAGHAPTTGFQFRKRDSTGNYNPGEWADGISLACGTSTVTGNVITDATDGAIVIFGATGSIVSGNTIISDDRQLLGGINMVDFWPFAGSFNGVQVTQNTIIAAANFIKVGIAVGSMTWGSDNSTNGRTFGGNVQGNILKAGQFGYFGYGISVGGHHTSSFSGNDGSAANYGGQASNVCRGIWTPPVAFVADPYTTPNVTIQQEFKPNAVNFMICNEPGPIIGSGYFNQPPPSNTTSPTGSAQQVPANDLALSAIATASSNLPNQEASKANDGIIGGVVRGGGDYTKEWASNFTKTGAWVQLNWNSSVAINSVVLYDRPNLDDQCTGGLLTFGDGTTIRVPALVNDGSASPAITFPTIVTNSLRFTIMDASSRTIASGLSEITVFGPGFNSSTTVIANSTTSSPSPSANSTQPTSSPVVANPKTSNATSTAIVSASSTPIANKSSTIASSTPIPSASSSIVAQSSSVIRSSTLVPASASASGSASASATVVRSSSTPGPVGRKPRTTTVFTTTTVTSGAPTSTIQSTSTSTNSTMTRPATQTYVAKVVSQTSSSAPTVITTTMTVTRTVAISATPYKTTAAPRRAVVNMSQLLPIPNFNLPLNLNLF